MIEGPLDDATFWKMKKAQQLYQIQSIKQQEGKPSEILYDPDYEDNKTEEVFCFFFFYP